MSTDRRTSSRREWLGIPFHCWISWYYSAFVNVLDQWPSLHIREPFDKILITIINNFIAPSACLMARALLQAREGDLISLPEGLWCGWWHYFYRAFALHYNDQKAGQRCFRVLKQVSPTFESLYTPNETKSGGSRFKRRLLKLVIPGQNGYIVDVFEDTCLTQSNRSPNPWACYICF